MDYDDADDWMDKGAEEAVSPFNSVTPDILLASTRKLLAINREEDEPDDRDSLANQTFYGPEDFFAERILKDAGGVGRNILWKSTGAGRLAGISSGTLTPQIMGVLGNEGLGANLEEVNPLETSDKAYQVTRLGPGGIPSIESVPDEARAVQPSHFGFVDAFRTPESEKIGVDSRLAYGVRKGSDGQLYSEFRNARTGASEWLSSQKSSDFNLAFPGELESGEPVVRGMTKGKMGMIRREDVDYELPSSQRMFNTQVNLIPMPNATQGNRLMIASKMMLQAMSLQEPEAPLVRSKTADGQAAETVMSKHAGAIRSSVEGVVTSVTPNAVTIQQADGSKKVVDLYRAFPMNRKSYINNTATVRPGDAVKPGQLLARSNYTDEKGDLAIGRNLRVAFFPYAGLTHEDAYVISASASKKMASERMYTPSMDFDKDTESGLDRFVSLMPGVYDRETLQHFTSDGVVKPGTILKRDQPMVLAIGKPQQKGAGQWENLSRSAKPYTDRSMVWEHDFDGEVTDVFRDEKGVKVAVRAYVPMKEADKIADRYGAKGVIAKIVPDELMPHDADGKPYDVIQNPITLPTRLNPAQVFEMQLAKIARKTGKPYLMDQFHKGSLVDYVSDELRKHGFDPDGLNDVIDPETGKRNRILDGEKFFMALHHTAESKSGARGEGSYTAEEIPTTGGYSGAKTIANLGLNALISHGATEVIADSKLVRGQKNDEYWRAFKMGYTPPTPRVPLIYRKFEAMMRGAGINLRKDGTKTHVLAQTDADVDNLTEGREIKNWQTVDGSTLNPIEDGLFDRGLTGGNEGDRWAFWRLPQPMPNPVAEEPIRRMLGLTEKQFEEVLAGTRELKGKTGPNALSEALKGYNVSRELEAGKARLTEVKGANRDALVKKLRFLAMMKRNDLNPADLMQTKVPIIPPIFRPIGRMQSGAALVADPNYLYQDMMQNGEALAAAEKAFGESGASAERLNLYRSLKAVTGLGDPVHPKLQEKNVGGLLKHVFGKGSPKFGMFQRKVIGMKTDMSARGAVSPNPSLDMDQLMVPEEMAWDLFKPFVTRTLVRNGMPASQALESIENRDRTATAALMKAMDERPVIYNRAPTLSRYGILAARAVLGKGRSIQVPPSVISGLVMDFDGDATQGIVIVRAFGESARLFDGKSKLGVDAAIKHGMFDLGNFAYEENMTVFKVKVDYVNETGEFFVVDLEDFPHTDEVIGTTDTATFYRVPRGIKTLSVGPDGRLGWYEVLSWSRHNGPKMGAVSLSSDRQYIADDDERSVLGIDGADMAWKRCRPSEATGKRMMVARAARIESVVPAVPINTVRLENVITSGKAARLKELLTLSSNVGYVYGVVCGDGWVTARSADALPSQTHVAGNDADVFAAFHTGLSEFFDGSVPESGVFDFKKDRLENRHGEATRFTVSSVNLTCMFKEHLGHRAANKHLPSFFLGAPEEFRWGLLAGLIDTDGTLSVSRAKSKARPQIMISFCTIGTRLAREVSMLCRSLGIRARITPFKYRERYGEGKRDAWRVSLSVPDAKRLPSYMHCGRKTDTVVDVPWPEGTSGIDARYDLVPFPDTIAEIVGAWMPGRMTNNLSVYSNVRKAMGTGKITRLTANVLLSAGLTHDSEEFELWRRVVEDTDITWDSVTSWEESDTSPEGYDLTVPGAENFTSMDGVVLSNTSSLHVPVSDKAVKEAYEKMLPSKHLTNVSTFKPHYLPTQEYALGLYLATKKGLRQGQARGRFRSKDDVRAAWRRGEIGLSDEIELD